MGAIYENTHFVHLPDDIPARARQRRRRVKAAATKKTGEIIGEIGYPEPSFIIGGKVGLRRIDNPIVGRIVAVGTPRWLKRPQILHADNHSNLARLLSREDVTAGLGQHEV